MTDEISYPEALRRAHVEKGLQRRWDALLRDVVDELRARGVERPEIFIADDSGLCGMDTGHPMYVAYEADESRSTSRSEAASIALRWPRGIIADVGAW